MDKEDIICMAREAELNAHGLVIDRLARFAELVVAHEREECAKIAEEWMVGIDDPQYQCDCATAIRRGKK